VAPQFAAVNFGSDFIRPLGPNYGFGFSFFSERNEFGVLGLRSFSERTMAIDIDSS
jgi:hypothetical protein